MPVVAAIEEMLTTSPSPPAGQQRPERPDRRERAAPVDLEHLVDQLVGQRVELAVGDRLGHAGRVDQDVRPAEPFGRRSRRAGRGRRCRSSAPRGPDAPRPAGSPRRLRPCRHCCGSRPRPWRRLRRAVRRSRRRCRPSRRRPRRPCRRVDWLDMTFASLLTLSRSVRSGRSARPRAAGNRSRACRRAPGRRGSAPRRAARGAGSRRRSTASRRR